MSDQEVGDRADNRPRDQETNRELTSENKPIASKPLTQQPRLAPKITNV